MTEVSSMLGKLFYYKREGMGRRLVRRSGLCSPRKGNSSSVRGREMTHLQSPTHPRQAAIPWELGLDQERHNSHTREYCTETNVDPSSSCNISLKEKQSSETVIYETHRQRHPNDRNDKNCRVQGTISDESDPLLLRGLVTPQLRLWVWNSEPNP